MSTLGSVGSSLRLVDWSRLRSHLLWAYQGNPATRNPRRGASRLSSAWLLVDGSVQVMDSGRTRTARAGQWVFCTNGPVAAEFSATAEVVSVAFQLEWPDERQLYPLEETLVCDAKRFPGLQRVARRLARLSKSFRPPKDQDVVHLLVNVAPLESYLDLASGMLDWAREYDRAMQALGQNRVVVGGGDARVVRVREIIESLPPREALNEERVARSVGLSVSQMNRLFVAAEQQTPRAYHQRRRVEFARHAVAGGQIPVKELAFMLGFRQPSHFSNWFKKATNQYPRAFRSTRAGKATDDIRVLAR